MLSSPINIHGTKPHIIQRTLWIKHCLGNEKVFHIAMAGTITRKFNITSKHFDVNKIDCRNMEKHFYIHTNSCFVWMGWMMYLTNIC